MNLQSLLELIRCPRSKGRLIRSGDWLVCTDADCRLKYEIKQDIPVLIPEEAAELAPTEWQAMIDQQGPLTAIELKP